MDGRMLRKWCVFGCLVATIGCDRGYMQKLVGRTTTEPAKIVNMSVGGKSFWGGSNNAPSVPVEVAPEVSKKPASADALIAMADVQLDAAFNERTLPGSREELLDRARKVYHKAYQQEPK